MSTPRPRVLRPPRPQTEPDPQRAAQLQKRHDQLDSAHTVFRRWMTKLKRAFHAIEREQSRINRLEREISRLTES